MKLEMRIKIKIKINKVYPLHLWYYSSFKVSLKKKLTFIFTSSSPTFLDISPQIFYHFTYTTSLYSTNQDSQ